MVPSSDLSKVDILGGHAGRNKFVSDPTPPLPPLRRDFNTPFGPPLTLIIKPSKADKSEGERGVKGGRGVRGA